MDNSSGISVETLHRGVAEAAASFEKFSIKYALIGGLATSARSQPRFTKDLDFLLYVPALVLPPLLEDLQNRGFEFDLVPTIREWTQHHMVVLSFQGVRVDWLKPVIAAYDHVIDRATKEPWKGGAVRIASAEGLILLKLMAFRPQDQIDIHNLIAASSGKLDTDWIRTEWQTIADLDDARMVQFMKWVANDADAES